MKLWIAFALREGLEGLRRSIFHSFVAVAALTLAVSFLGFFGYGAINLQRAAEGLLESLQFEVFISPAIPETEHPLLKEAIREIDPRWGITYISRDSAAATFAREFDPELFNILKENPLPASFRIDLPASQMQPDSAELVVESLLALKGIDDVIYDRELLEMVYSGMGKLALWGLGGGLFAIILSVGLTFNAIRLKIDGQHESLHLMSLLSATPGMLRAIFLVQGTILGLVGGLLSSALILGVGALIRVSMSNGMEITVPHPYLLIIVGGVLGMLGALLAVGRYLEV